MNQVRKLVCRLACLTTVIVGLPVPAETYVSTLTFPNLAGGAQLENFPLLVRLAEGNPSGFSYADCPSAARLAFSQNVLEDYLPFEVDTWDTNGVSRIWVSIPTLTPETTVEMFWYSTDDSENPAPGCVNDAGEVWARADYIGVWHLNGRNADGMWPDSTTNALHATPYSASIPALLASDSPLGGACAANMLDGTAQSTGGARILPAQLADIDFGGRLTFSGWVCRYPGGGSRILASSPYYARGFSFSCLKDGMHFMSYPSDTVNTETITYCIGKDFKHNGTQPFVWGSGVTSTEAWHYFDIHIRADGNVRAVENGVLWKEGQGTGVTVAPIQNPRSNGIALGSFTDNSRAFGGKFDELRLSLVEHSAAWTQTEYEMQTRGDFIAMSPARELSATTPGFACEMVERGIRFAQLWIHATSFGAGATSGTFRVGFATHGETVTTAPATGLDFLQTFKQLQAGTSYDYVVAFTNELGNGADVVRGTFETLPAGISFARASDAAVSPHTGLETLENFPLPLRLSPARISGFDYAACRGDGSDVRIFDAGGSLVPSEVEAWNTNGETVVWVSLANYPGMGGTAVPLTVKWGVPAGLPMLETNPCDIWTRANYVGVWHLSRTEADGSYTDSTGHGLSASRASGAAFPCPASEAVVAAGPQLGAALTCGGGTSGNGLVVPPGRSAPYLLQAPFTLSGWGCYAGGNYGRFLSTGVTYTHVNMSLGPGRLHVMGENSVYFTATLADQTSGVWHHYAAVFDNASSRAYADGDEMGNSPGNAQVPPSLALQNGIGLGTFTDQTAGRANYQPFNGTMDEMRIRQGASSSDWIAAEHAVSCVASCPVTFSAARDVSGESGDPAFPVVRDIVASLLGDTGVTLSWCVDWAGDEADTVTIECEYGLNPDGLDWCETVATNAIGRGSFAREARLLPERTYWLRLKVTGGTRVTRSPAFSVTTRAGASAIPPEQPILSVTNSFIQVDRFTLSGTLACGDGSPAGTAVRIVAGGLSVAGTVAADGTWSLTLAGFTEGQLVRYYVEAETTAGHFDRLAGRQLTMRTAADVDFVWQAEVPAAWTNPAAWHTSLMGAIYPHGATKSVTFPEHCCATVTVAGAQSAKQVSFSGLDHLRLVGEGTGAKLEVTHAVSAGGGVRPFREGATIYERNVRLLIDNPAMVSYGDGVVIDLDEGSQLVCAFGPIAVSPRIRIADSVFSGGYDQIGLADAEVVLENGHLGVFRSLATAAAAGRGGTHFTLRGTSSWIDINTYNGKYTDNAAFWSNHADTQIAFELTGETLARTPVTCHAASSTSNRPMGAGEGTGRIVLNVPRTAPIAKFGKAVEIPLVAWSAEGIDTNRVVFGTVACGGDSFAYTWPEDAAPDSLPTGVIYRHVPRHALMIIVK